MFGCCSVCFVNLYRFNLGYFMLRVWVIGVCFSRGGCVDVLWCLVVAGVCVDNSVVNSFAVFGAVVCFYCFAAAVVFIVWFLILRVCVCLFAWVVGYLLVDCLVGDVLGVAFAFLFVCCFVWLCI